MGLFLLVIIPFSLCCIIPITLICISFCKNNYKENKKEKQIKTELLGLEERKKKSSELYPLIKKNYNLINMFYLRKL